MRDCPVCCKMDCEYLYSPAKSPGPITRCRGCGFVYVNPIEDTSALILDGPVLRGYPPTMLESDHIEDIQGTWEQPMIEQHIRELPAKKINAQDVLKHIEAFSSGKGRLLDIGCFCGVFLITASDAGWDSYGIEPLFAPAIYARAAFKLPVITDTLREDTYPPETFDVITAFQVFEHLMHPNQVIEVIHRILKPRGLLLIEIPNIDTIAVRILAKRHRHFTKDHISFFTSHSLQIFLEQFGFRVRKIYYPSRAMSLRHLFWWVKKHNQKIGELILNRFPKTMLDRTIRISLRDIVAYLAEKIPEPRIIQS